MRGHNSQFGSDPLSYITQRSVNNLTWFRRAVAAGNASQESALNNSLALHKFGYFDLEAISISSVEFKVVASGVLDGDVPLGAYWCPFIQGGGLPGYVEIPKLNPVSKFMFTAGMNGCRFVVTDFSATHWRVYHNQHPDGGGEEANVIWALINGQGHNIVGHFGTDEYNPGDTFPPNAFNFLYYRNGEWNFVSQEQTFNMLTLEVTRTPGGARMRPIM